MAGIGGRGVYDVETGEFDEEALKTGIVLVRGEGFLLVTEGEQVEFQAVAAEARRGGQGAFAVARDEVELVRREVETRCRAIGRKLAMVINYDQFYIDPAISDAPGCCSCCSSRLRPLRRCTASTRLSGGSRRPR